jgi:ferritin
MRKASAEEQTHADKIGGYLIDRNACPLIDTTPAYTAPDGAMLIIGRLCFAAALQREMQVTEMLKTIYDLADQADDPQTCIFLQWFLAEQTSAERELIELVARLQFAEGCPAGILQIDRELGA